MKMRFFRIISLILVCSLMFTGMSVASTAVVEVNDDLLIYGSDIAVKEDYNIVPGVTESYVVTQNDDGSNRVNSYVLEIDMNNPEIGILATYKDYMNGLGDASWGMQAVRDQAVEVEDYYRNQVGNEDFEIVAGVNGDFFNMGNGAPTGTFVMNSIVYNVNEDWPYFAILEDGTAIIRDRSDPVVDNIAQAVGGPEVIIKDGQLTAAASNSGYGIPSHPRTAVGIKADGDIVFVVSDGRQFPESCGQTFPMLAEEMLALGCVDALSLDGGGSASFVSQREGEDTLVLRNSPADGIERTVSTALLIYTNTDTNVASDANKWFENNGKIGYKSADGVPVTGEQTIDGFTYVFDEYGVLTSYAEVNVDGTLVTNAWSGTKYYLGEDGMPVKGEKQIGGTTFTFNAETGVLEKSSLKSMWYECGQAVCYFDKNGNIVKGKQQIGGYTYQFDNDGKLTVYACVRDDGTLVTNQWIGKSYYLGDDGLPVTGKQKLDKYTYTFGNDGKLIKGALVKEGNYTYYYIAGQKQRNWHLIDGYWHYFDRQTGFGMATGANSDKVSIDFDRTDGLYTVSTTDAMLLFKFDNNGRLIRGAWLETDYGKAYYWGNHERITGWQLVEDALYYFNEDTYNVIGKQTIDGVEYTFDDEGRLQMTSGNLTIDNVAYFFNSKGEVEHAYSLEVVPPTCIQQGYTVYTCECGDSYKDDYVDAVPHDYDILVTAPTCAQDGFSTYTCKVCGETKTDDAVGATGHDYVSAVTPPTTESQGYTTYTCTVCGDSYVSDYVGAIGHEYEAVITAPTCTQKGYTTYTCTSCGDSYVSDYADATGHDHVAVVTAPTCTKKGYTTYTCICGDSYVSDYVDTAHTAGEWIVVTPAQVGKEGLEKTVCTVCGAEMERVIPALEGPTEDTSDNNDDILIGDVNGDGSITAMDARLALRISAKLDVPSTSQLKTADFNGDGNITAMDARLILRKAAKLD